MKNFKLAVGAVAMVLIAGAPASAHMSKSHAAMMKRCHAMSHSAMMKNHGCASMMKHNMSKGSMKGGMMGNDSMSNGMMSNSTMPKNH
ncbi:hypothetical protein [Sphingomonas sp. 10B4]|uniref:hypothetical protein n=1 Tax=Sphingomonas sp. 10B4 TaxID=3048575 RepID=UPI0019879082|nr:hypothetical protein [Sphingomonas sp. 10B4]MBC7504680.1 hypothetical protein [Sandarakinorhabdus sp.]MDY7522803.1 hypothetical protein [Sphingomonas sp. 10B4]MEB0284598.1 hypothetical protein [Sphingomonas sp. 10B4]